MEGGREEKIGRVKKKILSRLLFDVFHCFRAPSWSGYEIIISWGPKR